MKIIEEVQIVHFRSFLGTPKKYETKIINLRDVNIFSGANDSGKSNVLRALNLFFNDEIAYGVPFDFERDFFAGKKDSVQKVIEISVKFNLSGDKTRDNFLPEKFTISKFYDRGGHRNYTYKFYVKEIGREITIDSRASNNENIKDFFINEESTSDQRKNAEKREWNYRVKFSGFLNKNLSYEYVPAIRDKSFFTHLFGRVISQAKISEERRINQLRTERRKIQNWQKTKNNKSEKKDFIRNLKSKDWRETRLNELSAQEKKESKFTAAIVNLENEINNYATKLTQSIAFLPNEFRVGKDLQEFFEGFDISTGGEKNISLNLRGDGLQAKFIPRILDFLSTIDSSNRYYIWGIEEPENSAEYNNQQELAKDIKDEYSSSKQIFITTHSEEFLQLYDGADVKEDNRRVNLYHVKKLEKESTNEHSQVFIYDADKRQFELFDQKSQLDDDLGQSYLRAKYSKELKQTEDKFIQGQKLLEEKILGYENALERHGKPVIFVEDSHTELYKIAWLKLNDINFTKDEIAKKFDEKAPYLIYSAEGASPLAGFLRTKNIDYFNQKKVIGLFDFDETGKAQFQNINNETYWKNAPEGNKLEGLYRRRNGHPCFVAMLLPVPSESSNLADLGYPSYIECENLLPKKFLLDNGFAVENTTTGNTKYVSVKDDKKIDIWKHSIKLPKSDFINFGQMYKTIDGLFFENEEVQG